MSEYISDDRLPEGARVALNGHGEYVVVDRNGVYHFSHNEPVKAADSLEEAVNNYLQRIVLI